VSPPTYCALSTSPICLFICILCHILYNKQTNVFLWAV
jgi:hypothetical protein